MNRAIANKTVIFFKIRTKTVLLDDEYFPSEVPEWDTLVFTMQWPLTACLVWKDGKPTHTCTLGWIEKT